MNQKNAMVMEDDDPQVEDAKAGKPTGNKPYDKTAAAVKTAELEVTDEQP